MSQSDADRAAIVPATAMADEGETKVQLKLGPPDRQPRR
jgi:hypothetical protein